MKRMIIAVGLLLALAGCSGHAAARTRLVDLHPFTSSGRLKPGYTLDRSEAKPRMQVAVTASPFGRAPETYSFGTTADNTAACWAMPSDAKSVLCLPADPWSHRLRLLVLLDRPATRAPKHPVPYGLVLADGRRCAAFVGGAMGGSSNGWVTRYYCHASGQPNTGVFADRHNRVFEKAGGRWYVHVDDGHERGGPTEPLHPKRIFVTEALFLA